MIFNQETLETRVVKDSLAIATLNSPTRLGLSLPVCRDRQSLRQISDDLELFVCGPNAAQEGDAASGGDGESTLDPLCLVWDIDGGSVSE